MYFSLEDNCFTTLSWFLPCISMNQPQAYYVRSLLNLLLTPTTHSIPPLKLPQSTRVSSLQVWVLSRFSHVWLCDPTDCSPPGSSAPGILQARILEWVACPLSGYLPNPRIELRFFKSPASAGGYFITSATWGAYPVLLDIFCNENIFKVKTKGVFIF